MARILTVAIEYELFSIINAEKNSFEKLKETTKISERPLKAILIAIEAMELITRDEEGKYRNSPLAENFLVKEKPTYFGDMILMQGTRVYELWTKLEQAVETNKPIKNVFKSFMKNRHIADRFTAAMHNSAIAPARVLSNIFDFSKYKHLLDIGGGSGAYSIELLKKYPNLTATLLENKVVCQIANEYVKRFSLSDRMSIVSGDVLTDNLPEDFDLALLSQVLHAHGIKECKEIIAKTFKALPLNGAIIINEFFLNDKKSGPLYPAIFSVLMLLESNNGSCYSIKEVSSWLTEAGFKVIDSGNLYGPHSYLTAKKL